MSQPREVLLLPQLYTMLMMYWFRFVTLMCIIIWTEVCENAALPFQMVAERVFQ